MGEAVWALEYMCKALIACMGKVCNKTSKVSHLQATINPPHNEKHPPCRHQSCVLLFHALLRAIRPGGWREGHMACRCATSGRSPANRSILPFLSQKPPRAQCSVECSRTNSLRVRNNPDELNQPCVPRDGPGRATARPLLMQDDQMHVSGRGPRSYLPSGHSVSKASHAGVKRPGRRSCEHGITVADLSQNPHRCCYTRMGQVLLLRANPRGGTRAACDIAALSRSPSPLGQSPTPSSKFRTHSFHLQAGETNMCFGGLPP